MENVTGSFGWKTKHILLNYGIRFPPHLEIERNRFSISYKMLSRRTRYTIWHGTRNIVLFIERSAIFIHSHINFIELVRFVIIVAVFLFI